MTDLSCGGQERVKLLPDGFTPVHPDVKGSYLDSVKGPLGLAYLTLQRRGDCFRRSSRAKLAMHISEEDARFIGCRDKVSIGLPPLCAQVVAPHLSTSDAFSECLNDGRQGDASKAADKACRRSIHREAPLLVLRN